MKNETIDAAVLSAIQNGVGFRKDIISRLMNAGLLQSTDEMNALFVDNSLKRLRAAKKISYLGRDLGWKVLS